LHRPATSDHADGAQLVGVGHRVVHGGLDYTQPVRVDDAVLVALERYVSLAPLHQPHNLAAIRALARQAPGLPQVACFDTAFHRDLPAVARLLPIPRRYQAQGVRRYGFHGLSYAYLLEELERIGGQDAARGRVILAHLGNGASLAAVRGGACLDTSMGFTPASGLVSSTRSGDLDPGLVAFLAQREGMTASQFHHMVNHESGLAGVSEISADMRELIAREDEDVRAAEAVALFCYQARKWVGAFTAALGGLDTLVFSAGIGERSALIRARICQGLDFLGLALDEARNAAHAAVISTDASRVAVRVMRTDEELMIARSVSRTVGAGADPVDDYAAR
jgi:acetate kinase